MALSEECGIGAHVPMILECQGAHPGLRGVDCDLNHVLGPVNEIGIRMDVAIDRALQQLVFNSGINLEHLRVVFEHLIEVVLGIELPDSFDCQDTAYEQLSGRIGIRSKITHKIPPYEFPQLSIKRRAASMKSSGTRTKGKNNPSPPASPKTRGPSSISLSPVAPN